MREMSPERIYDALTTGVMKEQGSKLSDADRRGVAEFMAGRPLGSASLGDAKNMPNQCRNNPQLTDPDPRTLMERLGRGRIQLPIPARASRRPDGGAGCRD